MKKKPKSAELIVKARVDRDTMNFLAAEAVRDDLDLADILRRAIRLYIATAERRK